VNASDCRNRDKKRDNFNVRITSVSWRDLIYERMVTSIFFLTLRERRLEFA